MGEELREKVRERYARTARTVRGETESGGSCCGSSCCVPDSQALENDEGGTSCCSSSCCGSGPGALRVDMTGGSYSEAEKRELPLLAADTSLGCGNPVALATLAPGEVVLDLGSGGGIDVLLSARRWPPVERRTDWT